MHTAQRSSDRESGQFVTPKGACWRLANRLNLEVHGVSETGPVRPANEDAFIAVDVAPVARGDDGHHDSIPLIAVADGVGGYPGGAQASRLVIRTAILEALRRGRAQEWAPSRGATAVNASLVELVHACQDAVVRCGASDQLLARMATTLTAGLIRGRTLHLAHVGDTRCYLSRRGGLVQLTTDQTMARTLEGGGAGALPTSSALHHVLTNALSANRASLEVEIHDVELHPGDAVVLCSDGLSGALSGDVILAILGAAPSAAAACRELVRRALDADGSDNVTVIVGRLRSGESRAGLTKPKPHF
jgi:protein phosphatase